MRFKDIITISAILFAAGCTPKMVTNTIVETDTIRLESIKEVTVMEHVIDSVSYDSLLNEYANLQNVISTPETRYIIQEKERLIKEEIIKSIIPDTTYQFTIPFKLSSPDSTFDSSLIVDIEFKGGKITHALVSKPVAIPYTSSTFEFSIERLNAWSKWMLILIVVCIALFIYKRAL